MGSRWKSNFEFMTPGSPTCKPPWSKAVSSVDLVHLTGTDLGTLPKQTCLYAIRKVFGKVASPASSKLFEPVLLNTYYRCLMVSKRVFTQKWCPSAGVSAQDISLWCLHTFSAFWLWSSVVSVLISVTTDISPTGELLVTLIFLWGGYSFCLQRSPHVLHWHGTSPGAAHPSG